MQSYSIRVNGRLVEAETEPGTPLLWVLRDQLGLLGTKYGCGVGSCGACLVHLGAEPVQSCLIPIERVGDSAITTIEGLTGRVAETLRRCWVEGRVPQCGYCQAGQIMRAAAFLSSMSHPGSEVIRAAMSPNLCRCGTYGRIAGAVERAARLLAKS